MNVHTPEIGDLVTYASATGAYVECPPCPVVAVNSDGTVALEDGNVIVHRLALFPAPESEDRPLGLDEVKWFVVGDLFAPGDSVKGMQLEATEARSYASRFNPLAA